MYIVNSSPIFPPLFHSVDLQHLKCISHLNVLDIFVLIEAFVSVGDFPIHIII